MDYRRKHATQNDVKLYSRLSELVSDTLCPLDDASVAYHKKSCIDRTRPKCGTNKLILLPEEKEGTSDAKVQWQRFEYVETSGKQ